MTEDDATADTPVPVAGGDAVQRHNARLRRPRIVYTAVVTVLVIVLGVVTVAAWAGGESNNSTLRTAASPPGDLALASPAAAPTRSWQLTSAKVAIGQPQWRGTVVASERRGVRGIDAQTGRTTWSYTRSDRTVCTAAQLAGVAMVVFRLRGNCDQVAGFDAETGARKWTRTLDFDGMPLTGTPQYDTSAQGLFRTLVIRTPSVIYAIDPGSGLNRWTYARFGCRITGATLGSSGALISQSCTSAVSCPDGQKYCAAGTQLLLRNGTDGRDDKSKDNPDKISWNLIGADAVPVSAGSLVSAVDTSGQLLHLNPTDGTVEARTVLAPVPTRPFGSVAVDANDAEIISIGDTTVAVRDGTAEPLWRRTGSAPATVVARSQQETPTLGTARVTIPSGATAATVDARTGRVSATTTLPDAPAGRVYPLGQGFLVAGTSTLTAYA